MTEVSFLTAMGIGFLGGVHCLGMCGGIVGAITLTSPASTTRVLFLNVGYNLGRITSYLIAGLLAGGLGLLLARTGGSIALHGLHLVAALLLIALGLYFIGKRQFLRFSEQAGQALWQYIQPWATRYYPFHTFPKAVLAGSLWGFIPCGMVYSVLAYAATAADPILAAKIMLGFGLGTLPNLMLLGMLAQKLRPLLQHKAVQWLAGLLMIGLGIWQLWPYLF